MDRLKSVKTDISFSAIIKIKTDKSSQNFFRGGLKKGLCNKISHIREAKKSSKNIIASDR